MVVILKVHNVLSINNSDFENDLDQKYPVEPEIKYTTESSTSASYLYFTIVDLGWGGLTSFPFITNATISISISQNFRS